MFYMEVDRKKIVDFNDETSTSNVESIKFTGTNFSTSVDLICGKIMNVENECEPLQTKIPIRSF